MSAVSKMILLMSSFVSLSGLAQTPTYDRYIGIDVFPYTNSFKKTDGKDNKANQKYSHTEHDVSLTSGAILGTIRIPMKAFYVHSTFGFVNFAVEGGYKLSETLELALFGTYENSFENRSAVKSDVPLTGTRNAYQHKTNKMSMGPLVRYRVLNLGQGYAEAAAYAQYKTIDDVGFSDEKTKGSGNEIGASLSYFCKLTDQVDLGHSIGFSQSTVSNKITEGTTVDKKEDESTRSLSFTLIKLRTSF